MSSFKNKVETEFAEKSYLSRPFVYLESEEDRQIIGERWFFDDEIEFRSSGEDSGGAGGCTMVIRKVQEDKEKGINSAGLIDRDILLKDKNWDLWWETDDEKLKASQPYGDNIRILCRWELENYLLLEPSIVESISADQNGRSVKRPAPIPLLPDDIELLKILTVADAICHSLGNSKVSDKMACYQGSCDELETSLDKEGVNLDKLHDENNFVTKFSEGKENTSTEYWNRQSRILNGKAILKRLNLLGGKLSDKNDFRLALASKIYETGSIDEEIKEYISDFRDMQVVSTSPLV